MSDPTAVLRATPAYERKARKRSLALKLTGVLVLIYAAFLILVLAAPAAMAADVSANLTLGLLFGTLAILAAIALSWVYVANANRAQSARAREGRS